MDVRVAPDAASAAAEAAGWVAHHLRNAVLRRGAATLAVSGGTTPAAMFRDLAELDVPWAELTIFQVDERVAPDGDPARNAGLLELLAGHGATLRAMPVTVADLHAGAQRYAATLPECLDVVHLGLGDDGHTASWPPGDEVVESTELVAMCGEYRGQVRMTLTPLAVNAARHRLVLAAGPDKAVAMERWLLGDPDVPVHRLRRSDTVVVIDSAAATRLPGADR
jgi:6-phosphogluconolactonase/glucosamine-6-phosphate isomerase/deaminase